ncbi:MAG TPA: CHASE2 domain-containing protein, partial [Burkholderiales bacterium]|nr:CHASE2 domain-containing protein [Burkholderiales bacterium]
YQPVHVALVEVDEHSLAKHEDPLAFWAPLHARVLANLREAGAIVIGVDFLFSITPETWLQKYQLSSSDGLKNYDLPFRQELNAGKTVLVGAISRGNAGGNDGFLLPHTEYLLSLPNADLESGIGLADLVIDSDGSIRRYAITPKLKLDEATARGAPRLTLGALLAVRATGLSAAAAQWSIGGLAYHADAVHNISYAGPPGTIPRVSFHKLLDNDALNNPEVKSLRGKVIIVGANFEGMNDVHDTPYSNGFHARSKSFMSGPEIQANIVETLLSGRATGPAPDVLRWLLTAVVLLAAIVVGLRTPPWIGLAAFTGGSLIALITGYVAFRQFMLFPAAHLHLGLFAGFFMVLGSRLTREERDKARIRNIFEGYVSDDVVNMLLTSGQRLDMGGQSMNISVLFSDIRNFT